MEIYGKGFPIAIYFECGNLEMICNGRANSRKKNIYIGERTFIEFT
jgi:hypothetical protein